jgi:acyl-CoA synthetase (NDP forming)
MAHLNSSYLNVKDISFINSIRSMAVIGTSKKRNFFFLRNHQENFKGPLYAIHPKVKVIPDFPDENIFPSIKDVPGNVDYAFITVPASQVLSVMDDCVDKGVKLVTVFSSEFSDSGTKEGIELEKELLKRARNKVRILGPNGLGIFYPKIGLAWRLKFPTTPGGVGFIAQSGGICNIAIYASTELGINFSKVFSFGNGSDLDAVDLLNFLVHDPETKIILCYIEGIKNGRISDLRKILQQNTKPIVALKGGKSEPGSIAAKTHTASISGDDRLWNSFFKQYNVIEVDTLEQLLYTARLIDCYGIFEINKVAVFSISGGYGVVLVDILEKYGIKVPQFSPEVQEELTKKFFMPGTSSKNPLDLAAQALIGGSVQGIINTALSDKKIDGLILDMPGFYISIPIRVNISATSDARRNAFFNSLSFGHKYGKPIIPIIQHSTRPNDRTQFFKRLIDTKIPFFGDPLEFIPLLPKISKYKRKLNKKAKKYF